MVASGGTDRVVNLWDVETSQKIIDLNDHIGNINAVRFLPESNCTLILTKAWQVAQMIRLSRSMISDLTSFCSITTLIRAE
jgi:WD40 repeat protein